MIYNGESLDRTRGLSSMNQESFTESKAGKDNYAWLVKCYAGTANLATLHDFIFLILEYLQIRNNTANKT
jgi:hypothetical protein